MKRNNHVSAICLTIFVSLSLATPCYAIQNSAAKKKASGEITLPQSQNSRHKLQHDARKKAARRLKAELTQVRAEKMARDVKAHGHYWRSK